MKRVQLDLTDGEARLILGLLALSADDPDGWGIGGCIPRTVNTALDKVRMAVNVKKKLLSAA
mgnify:CR=1 FL=1